MKKTSFKGINYFRLNILVPVNNISSTCRTTLVILSNVSGFSNGVFVEVCNSSLAGFSPFLASRVHIFIHDYVVFTTKK